MIYLLEDDDSIRDLVIYTLQSQGTEAKGFPRPSAFWEAMAEHTPSLVLLDIMLPEEDGISVLKKLRSSARTSKLPVIMLTAKGTEYDKLLGQCAGCPSADLTNETLVEAEVVKALPEFIQTSVFARPEKEVSYDYWR